MLKIDWLINGYNIRIHLKTYQSSNRNYMIAVLFCHFIHLFVSSLRFINSSLQIFKQTSNHLAFRYNANCHHALNVVLFSFGQLFKQNILNCDSHCNHYHLPKVYNLNMSQVTVERSFSASRPMLLHVDHVLNQFPKTAYVVYYRNYTQQDEQLYKSLTDIKELFLPHEHLEFKIINFQKETEPVIVRSQSLQKQNRKVVISLVRPEGSIIVTGTLLNQSRSEDAVIDFSLIAKTGYDEFYKYRKKFKTLENLTRKLEFQLDHRITVKIGGRECRFDLEEKKKERYFFNLAEMNQEIKVVLEETVSIEDAALSNAIDETEFSVTELSEQENSYTAKLKYNGMFEVVFLFDLIKNENLAASDLVSVRLFETSSPAKSVRIGTEQTLHLNSCLKLQPLMNNRFFDYQWGYLNENLSKVDVEGGIYAHLDKLTPSLPDYPHFANQDIIDLKGCNSLIFDVEGQIVKIPLVYVLKGFNFVESRTTSVKFYIDSQKRLAPTVTESKSDCKRIYELNIHQIWNMSKINLLLNRANTNLFQLKIVAQDTIYFIPFQRKLVGKNEYRKEAKELATRTEVAQKLDNKYVSLQNCKGKEQLYAIQSNAINPFYILQMTSSSAISLQVIIGGAIALEGTLPKSKIVDSQGNSIVLMLASVEGDCKIGLVLNFVEIKQQNESAGTYYNFKHRLSFAQPSQSEEAVYDIEIQFQKQANRRPLRSKLSPESKRQSSDGIFLRDFPDTSGIFTKQQRLFFTLKIRKMFYNDQLNYFDNELLLTKPIAVNPNADTLKQDKSIMLRLERENYQGVEFDLYDNNIKRRMKYYLEIYAEKNEFLDHKDSSYKIKLPNVLWNFTNCFAPQTDPTPYQITTHLNRRNKNIDKSSFPPNAQQELVLDHYNYNDGISLSRGDQIAYSKFLKCIKLRCDVVKDKIGWSSQSDWYLAVLTLGQGNFYFMVQRLFDPYEEKKDSGSESSRTVSRDKSTKSDKMKIDPLAKTINNMDLFKLKKKKNELVAEGRQLTARYVKRQEQILKLNKQLEEFEDQLTKKRQEDIETKQLAKRPNKQTAKLKQFYRSICECGERNPQFNGYCESCLKKIKQRYEIYSKEYSEKSCEYEKLVFEKYNQKEKIERVKRKIEAYRNHTETVETDDGDATQYLLKNVEEKAMRKTLEELKMDIFDLEEEKHSLLETSNWQMRALESKISAEDEVIYKNSQELDSLRNRLKELTLLSRNRAAQPSEGGD